MDFLFLAVRGPMEFFFLNGNWTYIKKEQTYKRKPKRKAHEKETTHIRYTRVIPNKPPQYKNQDTYKGMALRLEDLPIPCLAKASAKPFVECPICLKDTSMLKGHLQWQSQRKYLIEIEMKSPRNLVWRGHPKDRIQWVAFNHQFTMKGDGKESKRF